MCCCGEQHHHQIRTKQFRSHCMECHLFTAFRVTSIGFCNLWLGIPFPSQVLSSCYFFFSFPIFFSATVLVLSVTCGPSLKRPYQPGSTLVRVETVASWKITFGRRSLSSSRQSIFTWRLQEAASRSPSLEETLITQEEPPGSSGSTSSRMKTGSKI